MIRQCKFGTRPKGIEPLLIAETLREFLPLDIKLAMQVGIVAGYRTLLKDTLARTFILPGDM
jgi:hypothetical protein